MFTFAMLDIQHLFQLSGYVVYLTRDSQCWISAVLCPPPAHKIQSRKSRGAFFRALLWASSVYPTMEIEFLICFLLNV